MWEHMNMAFKVEKSIMPMEEPLITIQEIKVALQKLKNNKSTGPDLLKPELYKALTQSDICMEALVYCFNKILEEGDIPENWKRSRIVMIPKVSKPKANQLRPIALTDVSYKLFMTTAIKKKIEDHLIMNDETIETQSGFTDGGRIENNLFLLKYCIEKSFQNKKPLIVISVDFAKAFDSVKRGKLIDVLMKYKVHPKVIDTVANIYTGDKTEVQYGSDKNLTIEVTSGIRQGCTGSTTLFKLVTYHIIKKLENNTSGYQDDLFTMNALFFADDGLLLTQSLKQAEDMIDMMVNIGLECGLNINKDKSTILVYNLRERPLEIRNIAVTNELKYLGITITDKRNCFKKQKDLSIEKAKKMANLTYPVISQSCNKLLIGKTFWKSIALPSVLYGASILGYTKSEMQKFQRIENSVYRQILGAPKYAQAAALRGEIGASSMMTRIIGSQVQYVQYIEGDHGGKNELLRRVMQERKKFKNDYWTETIKNHSKNIVAEYNQLKTMTKDQLKKKIQEWDSRQWKQELNEKTSLKIYKQWKEEIRGEEELYDNRPSSVIFFKCRTNNLHLKDRNRHSGGDTACDLCGAAVEDLRHFVLWCQEFKEERSKEPLLQQPYIQDEDQLLGELLFEKKNIKITKEYIYTIWKKREKKRKEV